MARARLIRPTFFEDVPLSELTRDVRLLYIGLWGMLDRRGVMEYHPKTVKHHVFPYDDDVSSAQVDVWVGELAAMDRVRLVEHGGKRYLFCPHLEKHQHFNVKEKPNATIPDEVVRLARHRVGLVPSVGADTVPTPNHNGADTPDTDTDTDTDTETTEPENPGSRGDADAVVVVVEPGGSGSGVFFVRSKGIKASVFNNWISLYGDIAWIDREILKAQNWCENNPHKAPRSRWGQFIGGWLERAWERHRKTLPPLAAVPDAPRKAPASEFTFEGQD